MNKAGFACLVRPQVRKQPSRFSRAIFDFSKLKMRPRVIRQPGRVSPQMIVPPHIEKPPYVYPGWVNMSPQTLEDAVKLPIEYKTDHEIVLMKETCSIARDILEYAGSLVQPGITSDEIDRLVFEKIVSQGAYPSPLGYINFPKSICTSINNVVCHGIPDDTPLRNGDIINIDVTVYRNGFHGDCSATFAVGQVADSAARLIRAAKEGLMEGIKVCGPGKPVAEIGAAIQSVADKFSYFISEGLTGHGIGRQFHDVPLVLHVPNTSPWIMKPGMTFTVEPIFLETDAGMTMWDDGWTLVSLDDSLSAQFEHTILITENGYEILTQ